MILEILKGVSPDKVSICDFNIGSATLASFPELKSKVIALSESKLIFKRLFMIKVFLIVNGNICHFNSKFSSYIFMILSV
jgi:hypothetical protein